MTHRRLMAALFACSIIGCASSQEPPAPGSREAHAKSCRESARSAEQIQFSPKGTRVTGDAEISLARRADPYAYARCMRAAGYADTEPAAPTGKPE